MSINITIEAANGADARQQMLDLLGVKTGSPALVTTINSEDLKVALDRTTKSMEAVIVPLLQTEENASAEDAPKPEQTTRKRRSKAEIEAEALAKNTGSEEPPASEATVDDTGMAESLEQDNAEQNTEPEITQESLTRMAVAIGRCGGRDLTLKLLKDEFNEATISKKDGKPTLTVEEYPAVVAGMQKIADDIYATANEDNKKHLLIGGFKFAE